MRKIYKILKDWKKECRCKGVTLFKYSSQTGILTIFTPYPGYFIGKAGCYIDKYTPIFKNEVRGFDSFKFEETSSDIVY